MQVQQKQQDVLEAQGFYSRSTIARRDVPSAPPTATLPPVPEHGKSPKWQAVLGISNDEAARLSGKQKRKPIRGNELAIPDPWQQRPVPRLDLVLAPKSPYLRDNNAYNTAFEAKDWLGDEVGKDGGYLEALYSSLYGSMGPSFEEHELDVEGSLPSSSTVDSRLDVLSFCSSLTVPLALDGYWPGLDNVAESHLDGTDGERTPVADGPASPPRSADAQHVHKTPELPSARQIQPAKQATAHTSPNSLHYLDNDPTNDAIIDEILAFFASDDEPAPRPSITHRPKTTPHPPPTLWPQPKRPMRPSSAPAHDSFLAAERARRPLPARRVRVDAKRLAPALRTVRVQWCVLKAPFARGARPDGDEGKGRRVGRQRLLY